MTRPRWPRLFAWEPFAALCAVRGITSPARALSIGGSTFAAMRAEGLTARQADHMACRLGMHPSEIWTGWFPADSEEEE